MRGYTLLFSLENFTLPPSQKLFKNFLGSLQFRGWTASSTECQVPRVDLWVGPMSDYTLQKRTLTFVCFWNRRFWRLVDPEMRQKCNSSRNRGSILWPFLDQVFLDEDIA
ncbi:hypothetical protein [White spot syndrome virus]|uniref:Uncharacterized protein n=1 Tax=White spot syndrome virus TaxID=342409 RepID=A0A109PNG6_9VIRU|nr:hypothetical protein [White spot syndrome virus]